MTSGAELMTAVEGELHDLAQSINAHFAAIVSSGKNALEHALACGDDLLTAKSKMKHGEWLPWLEENCDVTDRSARRYMTLAKLLPPLLESKTDTMSDLDVTSGLKLIRDERRAQKDKERAKIRRAAAKAIKKAKTIEEALGAAKFSTVCIDPPWDWKDEGDNSQFGRGNTTYGAMSHEQLLEFPVGQYGADNSHIYLWITNRSLPKGFSLLEAWDYRYVTCLTWCKPSIGMGNYYRGSTEHILFGVRGSLPLNRKDVGTWFAAPRGKEHSEKPDDFYGLVESCSPGPYLDVFSRRERKGWVCWGGEL